MPTLDTALAFFGLSILLSLSPGPDNVFVLMQSATQGRKAGLLVTLGLCTGLIGHTAAVALGLAALLAASATAFTLLKLAGAAYLLYLAWGAFRAPVGPMAAGVAVALNPWRMVGRGVVMNLSNPKVGIFFLAFLPQFVRPEAGSVALQVAWLGGLFMLAALLVFGTLAWFASLIGARFQRSLRAQRALNWSAGTIFVGLAARLAWSEK
ncbi:MAG: LysE family translocator [Polaromonas sp.]|nr:LysE family translocator [Polaromonas sp.]